MRPVRSLVLSVILLAAAGCANRDPVTPTSAPPPPLAACPCANTAMSDGGEACTGGMMGDARGRMGPGRGGAMMMMQGGPMMGAPSAATNPSAMPAPLSADAKSALLRALDEEYRAESLYGHIAAHLGAKPPLATIARAEHRHAWVLESLALAHGVELPPNPWTATKQPDLPTVAAACRAGVDSEKKTIATYDELLKLDLPTDLRRAFANLHAASAERHLPAFEACR